MLKPFTTEGRFECGLDEIVAGKVWAFVPVIGPVGGPGTALGVAVANERGYHPVPVYWCHADTWAEMETHVDELNAAEGLSEDEYMRIVATTMRAQNRKTAS